jgi:hypothetical protein
MLRALARELCYTRYHSARPCIDTLVSRWGYARPDALQFAVTYANHCPILGRPLKVICLCPSRTGKAPCEPSSTAYIDGCVYASAYDCPPCHTWLRGRYDALDVLHWMAGFRDEKVAHGWLGLINWHGAECRCGSNCMTPKS